MGRHLPVLHRPQTREECIDGPRPCPFVSCRYSLSVYVATDGRVWENHKGTPSCALDVADSGVHTQAEVATLTGLSRQRITQIERAAIQKIESLWPAIRRGNP